MSKRWWLTCLVALLIAAAHETIPTPARGQGQTFRIIGPNAVLVGENVYGLDRLNPPIGWHQISNLPPVPASSLVSLGNGLAVTDTGEGWIDLGVGNWQSFGPVPGVVATKQSSWGAVKARYR